MPSLNWVVTLTNSFQIAILILNGMDNVDYNVKRTCCQINMECVQNAIKKTNIFIIMGRCV